MLDPPLETLHAHIRGLALAHADGLPSDRELLERFLAQRDEAAFAALVHRHGPMVLGACRRLLHCEQDAEDACQATFLLLATRGKAIRKGDALPGWLHAVACRIARKLRSDPARRRINGDVPERAAPESDALLWCEVRAVLDEELERLPECYRAPLVLCYLEGLTRDEAARRLGWTLASLRGRLERARDRLRIRLNRRGVSLSLPLLAGSLTSPPSLPPTLAATTVRNAVAGAVPRGLVTLTEGVLNAMRWTWYLTAATVILGLGLVGLSAGLVAQSGPKKEAVDAPLAGPRDPGPSDLERRVELLEKQVAQLKSDVAVLRTAQAPVKEDSKGPAVKKTIPLKSIKAEEAVRVLRDLFGADKEFTVNVGKDNAIMLSGSPEVVAKAANVIEKIDVPPTGGKPGFDPKPRDNVNFFDPKRQDTAKPGSLQQRVEDLEKQVGQLVGEVDVLKKTTATPTKPGEVELMTKYFRLSPIWGKDFAKVVENLFRDSKTYSFSFDAGKSLLAIRASAADVLTVERLLEKWEGKSEAGAGKGEAPALRTYRLTGASAADVVQALQKVFPDSGLRVAQVGERAMIVHGTPKELALVEDLVRQIEEAAPVPKGPSR